MRNAILYSRPDCHLCHRAEAKLRTIARELPLIVELREPPDAYRDRIPVIEIDGVVVAEGPVSEYRLRRSLGMPLWKAFVYSRGSSDD